MFFYVMNYDYDTFCLCACVCVSFFGNECIPCVCKRHLLKKIFCNVVFVLTCMFTYHAVFPINA